MKIGLIDEDSKIPNLALMKISTYHKAKGDSVKLYDPLFDSKVLDLAYASKVFFRFSPPYQYFPECKVIRGGSGYDLETKLPEHIESLCPDYSLYGLDYAMGFSSRGCPRSCSFCIVPQKEGKWRAVADIKQFRDKQTHLLLLDGNLTADHEHFMRICKQLVRDEIKVNISQGLDIRYMDEEKSKILAKVKRWENKRIHFAWDNLEDEQEIRHGIEIVTKWIKPRNIMFYILIGWDTSPDEDLYRVEVLRSLGIEPFIMPYNKKDPYQADFARWANVKSTFAKVPWHKYKRRSQMKGGINNAP